jgi:hypothetical protein
VRDPATYVHRRRRTAGSVDSQSLAIQTMTPPPAGTGTVIRPITARFARPSTFRGRPAAGDAVLWEFFAAGAREADLKAVEHIVIVAQLLGAWGPTARLSEHRPTLSISLQRVHHPAHG